MLAMIWKRKKLFLTALLCGSVSVFALTTQIPINDLVAVVNEYVLTDTGLADGTPVVSLNTNGQGNLDILPWSLPPSSITDEDLNFEIQRPIDTENDVNCDGAFVRGINKRWDVVCHDVSPDDVSEDFDDTVQRRIQDCPSGTLISAIARDGSVTCAPADLTSCNPDVIVARDPAPPEVLPPHMTTVSTNECGQSSKPQSWTLDIGVCGEGLYLQGRDSTNTPVCVAGMLIEKELVCPEGKLLQGFDQNGSVICVDQCQDCGDNTDGASDEPQDIDDIAVCNFVQDFTWWPGTTDVVIGDLDSLPDGYMLLATFNHYRELDTVVLSNNTFLSQGTYTEDVHFHSTSLPKVAQYWGRAKQNHTLTMTVTWKLWSQTTRRTLETKCVPQTNYCGNGIVESPVDGESTIWPSDISSPSQDPVLGMLGWNDVQDVQVVSSSSFSLPTGQSHLQEVCDEWPFNSDLSSGSDVIDPWAPDLWWLAWSSHPDGWSLSTTNGGSQVCHYSCSTTPPENLDLGGILPGGWSWGWWSDSGGDGDNDNDGSSWGWDSSWVPDLWWGWGNGGCMTDNC